MVGATNNFLNGDNYSSQTEPSAGMASVFMREAGGDIASLFYVFYFTAGGRER